MEQILVAEDIYKTYRTASGPVRALQGISLSFETGLFYAVIGRSGSGKSTLLHVLSGLDRPDQGTVRVEGRDLYACSDHQMAIFRRRYTGFVFQQYNLLDEYNVRTNICMPLTLDGRKADRQFLDQLTKILMLEDKLDRYPEELSGGEQQRVAIARSVIARPRLIFADEPTGNLDRKTGEETMKLLKSCAKAFGQTLIVVTHDLETAREADRLIHIEDGRVTGKKEGE